MMKGKRIIALAMALVSSSALFVACGVRTKNDPNTLYVGNFDGGLGTDWLRTVVEEFKKDYPQYKVEIDPMKEEYRDQYLLVNMPDARQDVYLLAGNSYYNMYDKDLISDMTACMTAKVYDEDGELAALTGKPAVGSMVDKMDPLFVEKCDASTFDKNLAEGTYYCAANFATLCAFTYDADLFEQKGYYFDSTNSIIAIEGTYNDTKYTDKVVYTTIDGDEIVLGTGPDGITGTMDDGLPVTWEDFMTLMDAMVSDSIIPLTWAGSGDGAYTYTTLLRALFANYEGKDNMSLFNYLEGTYNGNNPDMPTNITVENAYELMNMNGRKAALKAMYDILSDASYYSPNAIKTGQDNQLSQKEYAMSPTYGTGKRVAMYMESNWWENEARAFFDAMKKSYPQYSWGQRNLKMMPVPNFVGTEDVPDTTQTKQTLLLNGGDSLIVMNKNVETNGKKPVAELFVQYLHSRTSLATHTTTNGVIRPYDYELNDAEYAKLTPYSKSVWSYYQEGKKGTYDMSCAVEISPFWSLNSNSANFLLCMFSVDYKNKTSYVPFNVIKVDGLSFADYIKGGSSWAKRVWTDKNTILEW